MREKLKPLGPWNLTVAYTVAISLAITGAASAHHALEALFDVSNEVQATASLTRVDWINPHAWMHFDFIYPNGQVEKNVRVETLGIAGLRGLGIDRDLLKVGALYQITYYPSRDGKPGGFMTRMVAPDGTLLGEPAYVPDECGANC